MVSRAVWWEHGRPEESRLTEPRHRGSRGGVVQAGSGEPDRSAARPSWPLRAGEEARRAY